MILDTTIWPGSSHLHLSISSLLQMKAEPIVFSGSASMEYLSDLCCGVHCWFFNPLFISALVIYIYIDVNFYFYADNSKIHMSSKSLVENVFFSPRRVLRSYLFDLFDRAKMGTVAKCQMTVFFLPLIQLQKVLSPKLGVCL